MAEAFANKNIFQAFKHYYRIVYSHNPLVNTLFKQFAQNLDDYVPQDRLFLTADALVHGLLGNDEDIADVAWTRAIKKDPTGIPIPCCSRTSMNNTSIRELRQSCRCFHGEFQVSEVTITSCSKTRLTG